MKYFISIVFILLVCLSNAQTTCLGCSCFKNTSLKWNVEVDNKGDEYLVRGDSLKNHCYSIDTLFRNITKNSAIHLKLIKIQNRTVYAKIVDTGYFAQMGYASVSWYLARLVFTLTENPDCEKVFLDFVEGDHTGPPGYFTRKDFISQYKICK